MNSWQGSSTSLDGLGHASEHSNSASGSRPDDKLARACDDELLDTCRRRKVKCNGPTNSGPCTNCIKHGIECTYVEGTRKRGPPKGYVEELERRVASLESQLASGSQAQSPSASTSQSPLERRVSPQDGHDDEEDELVEKMTNHNISGHYHGRSSISTLFISYNAFRRKSTGKTEPCDHLLEHQQPSFIERLFENEAQRELRQHPLPEPDLVRSLLDIYFTELNPTTPLIHRAHFERCLAANLAATSSPFRALVFALMASAARRSSDPRVLHRYAWLGPIEADAPDQMSNGYSFFFASLRLVASLAPTGLYHLQAMTILIDYITGAGSVLVAWQLIGFMGRLVVSSGAHCLRNEGWNASLLTDELRKRSFWAFYALDRSMSVNLGRPFAIPDDIIDVDLPLDLDEASLDYYDGLKMPWPRRLPTSIARPGGLCAINAMAALMGHSERLVKSLYNPHTLHCARDEINALEGVLQSWLDALPEELRWNPAEQDTIKVTRSAEIFGAYYGMKLALYRSLFWPDRKADVAYALPAALQAVHDISLLVENIVQRGMIDCWAFVCPVAMQSSLILVLSAYQNDKAAPLSPSAKKDLERIMSFMASLAPTTWASDKCHRVVTQLVDRVEADASRPLKRPSDASSPSSDSSSHRRPQPQPSFALPTADSSNPFGDPNATPSFSLDGFNSLASFSPSTGVATLLGGGGGGEATPFDFNLFGFGGQDWLGAGANNFLWPMDGYASTTADSRSNRYA